MRWLDRLPIEVIRGDLLDPASLPKCFEEVEYIIHIAGITKAKYRNDFLAGNAIATQNLLNAASQSKHLKKFCYISSLTAVGPSAHGIPLAESALCHPITTYGESKLEAERHCQQFMDQFPIVIIRPPAVFGPRDTDILELFKWVQYGIRPIIGSSAKTVSFLYAPDLAKGIVQATLDERTRGETYFIADPTIFDFSYLVDSLATFINKRTLSVHIPKGLVYSMAGITQFLALFGNKPAVLNIEKARDLVQKHWVCNPQKIKDHIGFTTTTPIDEGIQKTYQWYRENNWL